MPKTPQDNMIDIPVVLSKKVDGVIDLQSDRTF